MLFLMCTGRCFYVESMGLLDAGLTGLIKPLATVRAVYCFL
jgi:hypothetical protein